MVGVGWLRLVGSFRPSRARSSRPRHARGTMPESAHPRQIITCPRLFHRAAHGVVDSRQIVCLRFIDVGVESCAPSLGAAVRNEARAKGARDDGCALSASMGQSCCISPRPRPSGSFQIHRLYHADVRAINPASGSPRRQRQLFRQCVVRLWNRRGGFGHSGGRSGSRGRGRNAARAGHSRKGSAPAPRRWRRFFAEKCLRKNK